MVEILWVHLLTLINYNARFFGFLFLVSLHHSFIGLYQTVSLNQRMKGKEFILLTNLLSVKITRVYTS